MPIREVQSFTVPHLQVLDEEGRVDAELEPKLSAEQLIRLNRGMLLARELDTRMLALQRQGRIGTFAPNTGQEAAVCGPALAMKDDDWFVPSFREVGLKLWRGESIRQFLMYHAGYEEGNVNDPPDQRNTAFQVIVGSQILHAVGLGYSIRYRGEKNVGVVAYIGDGGTSEGDFHEAMNFATLWQVPVVIVCQNNHWAISVPRAKQTASTTIAQKGIAYGMNCMQVDGNDALATYKAVRDALDRGYAGGGPTFIEAVTYRLMMHTTADDPSKYRDEAEVEVWRKRDPLIRFNRDPQAKRIWDDGKQEAQLAEVKAEVDAGVREFEASIEGGVKLEGGQYRWDLPFEHLYEKMPKIIQDQRDELVRELKEAGDA